MQASLFALHRSIALVEQQAMWALQAVSEKSRGESHRKLIAHIGRVELFVSECIL